MKHAPFLGKRVRALRTKQRLTQAALAERLGISASYLNLIEHDRRPVSANVLLRLAQAFDLDLRAFAASEGRKLLADVAEVFGDPVFEERRPAESDLRDFVATSPDVARAVVRLHHAYNAARGSADSLAAQVVERQDLAGMDRAGLSAEQVSELVQRHQNHFPELEAEAERVRRDARGDGEDLYAGLASYLERVHRITIQIRKVGEMGAAVRRFDPDRRLLVLSEALRRGSRNFQLAHQVGLLDGSAAIDRAARDPTLTTEESAALCRVVLANYFAAAVLMPYGEFLGAAEEERYDLELLGHRFRSSFEQIAHRVTTLQRPAARGVPFHIVRIDIAGNISKKFSATGIRLPRFGGLCPLWNVQAAFLQPGRIRTQLARLPDGTTFFEIARTVRKHRGGWNAPDVNYAIGLGCSVKDAKRLVYASGTDLANPSAAAPVGITCRLCERADCRARAFPSIHQPLRINENVRGISFFAPIE